VAKYKYDPMNFDGELRDYIANFYRAYEEQDESTMSENLSKIGIFIGNSLPPSPRYVDMIGYLYSLYLNETDDDIGLGWRAFRFVNRNIARIKYRYLYLVHKMMEYGAPESDDDYTLRDVFRGTAARAVIGFIWSIQVIALVFSIWCVLSLVSYIGIPLTDVQIIVSSILLGLFIPIIRLGVTKEDVKKWVLLLILGYIFIVLHAWYRTGNLIFIPK